jgi:hypothetical protein
MQLVCRRHHIPYHNLVEGLFVRAKPLYGTNACGQCACQPCQVPLDYSPQLNIQI